MGRLTLENKIDSPWKILNLPETQSALPAWFPKLQRVIIASYGVLILYLVYRLVNLQLTARRYRQANVHLRRANDMFRQLEITSSSESISSDFRQELRENMNQAMSLVRNDNIVILNLQETLDQQEHHPPLMLQNAELYEWRRRIKRRTSLGQRRAAKESE